MIYFILAYIITIIAHELAHLISAKLCGIEVEIFSIGFWKPYLSKKIKGIEFRITPFLVGGYCALKGENSKEPNGFLVSRYRNKVIILLAGITVNLIIALLSFLYLYKSIFVGIHYSNLVIKAIFTKDLWLTKILIDYNNLFVFYLALFNYFSFLFNILPIPALDGGQAVYVLLEKIFKERFVEIYNRINTISFSLLMLLQIIVIVWLFI